MNNLNETSDFQEFQTKVWYQHMLKKVDPVVFSFWVNGIFSKKKDLRDKSELMQNLKINCQKCSGSWQLSKTYINLTTDNFKKSEILLIWCLEFCSVIERSKVDLLVFPN